MTKKAIRLYWWTYPSRVALFVMLPIFLACATLGEADFAVYKHSHKFLSGDVVHLGMAVIIGFAVFSFLFEPRRALPDIARPIPAAALDRAIAVIATLVVFAYVVFLSPLLFRPQLMLEHMQGSSTAMYTLRETLNRVPGVTSFMALQSLLAVLIVCYTHLTGQERPRILRWLLVAVAICCVLRSWLWSERLATIELFLPIMLLTFARISPAWSERPLRPFAFAPAAGFVALLAVFTLGEYFRSWQTYQHVFPGTFADFIAVRFAGYYATALNNGAALVTLADPFYAPVMTGDWLAKFPLADLQSRASTNFEAMQFLDAYLNPELNNMSGIFLPIADFGPVFGILAWCALGALSGWLLRSAASGCIAGLLFYPVWFTGVIEMLRVFYWGETRFFPVVLGALALTWYLGRQSEPQVHHSLDASGAVRA